MTRRKRLAHHGWRALLLGFMLVYWFLMTRHLDRFPRIHYDEPIIVTPGYKLFSEGVYGSDLYTGFHRQEQIYLETLPLMPVLQGVSTWLLGVGVWQMRYLAVTAGLLVLALTYAVGARIAGSPRVGALAAWLLLTWRLTPGGDTFLGSGVTLLDVARIARYDILVPVLGLASLLLWREAISREPQFAGPLTPTSGSHRHFYGAGLLAGLAGFANLYGLFWVAALGVLWLIQVWYRRPSGTRTERASLSVLATFTAGWAIPWLGWAVVLGINWRTAGGQFVKHSGRADLLNPLFYVQSLVTEPQRYALGVRQLTSYGRLGFWLFLVGVPLALIWITIRAVRKQDEQAMFLLIPALVIPLGLALFVNLKRYYYIVTLMPLLAVIVAWATVALISKWQAARRRPFWVGLGLLLLVLWIGQWLAGVRRWQETAAETAEPAAFFEELRALIPADSVTIGPPDYWFAFHDREYRSLGLLFVRSNPGNPQLVPFITALDQVAPDYVLVHPSLPAGLEVTDDFDGGSRQEAFRRFMAAHEARPVADLIDFNGDPVRVYRLAYDAD